MPDTFIASQDGRLETKYHDMKGDTVSLLLHAHPLFGGNMNNQIMYDLYWCMVNHGHSVIRFNFRGVGNSDGTFSNEEGEISDANTVFDWALATFPGRRFSVIGVSFGAWVGANLMARRPEVERFVAVSPLVNFYSFGFMTEFCSAKCLFLTGTEDSVVRPEPVEDLLFVLKNQNLQGDFTLQQIEGANHFFDSHRRELIKAVTQFVDPMISSRVS